MSQQQQSSSCEYCWKQFPVNKQHLNKRHCSEKCRKKHERKRWREGNKEVKLFGTRIGFHIEMITKYPDNYR